MKNTRSKLRYSEDQEATLAASFSTVKRDRETKRDMHTTAAEKGDNTMKMRDSLSEQLTLRVEALEKGVERERQMSCGRQRRHESIDRSCQRES